MFHIAIDGPGGAGKSTIAKAVAKKLDRTEKDDYQASVIAFYASVLGQKSLILVDYYRSKEAKRKE